MLIRTRLHQYLNRAYASRFAIWAHGIMVPRHNNILAVLRSPSGALLHLGHNIVTNDGDLFYAYRSVDAQPTDGLFTDGAAKTFDGIMELGTAGATPGKTSNRSNVTTKVASSQQAIDGTYPTINDGDTDNTGAGVDIATYRVSYATGAANDTGIDRVIITNPSPGASEVLLMYGTLTSFNKTSSDTLKMFVNHEMLGV